MGNNYGKRNAERVEELQNRANKSKRRENVRVWHILKLEHILREKVNSHRLRDRVGREMIRGGGVPFFPNIMLESKAIESNECPPPYPQDRQSLLNSFPGFFS